MSLLYDLQGGFLVQGVKIVKCSEAGIIAQSINLESVGNARELGGYPTLYGKRVKRGVFLRTAELAKISSRDIARLTEIYHLAVIADLRMSSEVADLPDPVIGGVKYVNLRVINEESHKELFDQQAAVKDDTIKSLMIIVDSGFMTDKLYIEFLAEESGKHAYREFFREILALPPGRSILFHCSQGKDRTGCAAMLILSALGVSEDIIMNDYVLTNTFNAEAIASQRKMLLSRGMTESEVAKYMPVLDEVNPQFMANVLSWLRENYGSPVGYIIDALGLTEKDIETLRTKFLE